MLSFFPILLSLLSNAASTFKVRRFGDFNFFCSLTLWKPVYLPPVLGRGQTWVTIRGEEWAVLLPTHFCLDTHCHRKPWILCQFTEAQAGSPKALSWFILP